MKKYKIKEICKLKPLYSLDGNLNGLDLRLKVGTQRAIFIVTRDAGWPSCQM